MAAALASSFGAAHLFRRALFGVVDDEEVLAHDLAEGRHRDLNLGQHTGNAL